VTVARGVANVVLVVVGELPVTAVGPHDESAKATTTPAVTRWNVLCRGLVEPSHMREV
jgi:hypothetical protein